MQLINPTQQFVYIPRSPVNRTLYRGSLEYVIGPVYMVGESAALMSRTVEGINGTAAFTEAPAYG